MIERPSLRQISILSRRHVLGSAAALLSAGHLAATPEMPETEDNMEGPFYKAGAPKRSKLRDQGMAGTPFTLTGKVLNTRGEPVSGAEVDVWQADDVGAYDNSGFTLRGITQADRNGNYKVETILPKHYKTGPNSYRPAHIHFKIRGKGVKELTTQLYFDGDKFNSVDRAWRKSLTIAPKGTDKGQSSEFQFVLRAV